jgi:hypothetical protein
MSGLPLPQALKALMGRRRAARIAMRPGGPVAVIGANLVNVSPYGMMIHSPLPMEPDSVHRFRLVVAEEKKDIEARVANCLPKGKHHYGIGLEFIGVPEEFREQIAIVLAPLSKPVSNS